MFSVPNLYRLPPHDHHGVSARSVLGPSPSELDAVASISSGLGRSRVRSRNAGLRPEFRRSRRLWQKAKPGVKLGFGAALAAACPAPPPCARSSRALEPRT